jgi:hypothetical protein
MTAIAETGAVRGKGPELETGGTNNLNTTARGFSPSRLRASAEQARLRTPRSGAAGSVSHYALRRGRLGCGDYLSVVAVRRPTAKGVEFPISNQAIMSRTRAAAYLVGGILLAAWLASAAGVTMRPRPIPLPRRSAEAIQLDAVASNVQSQASRLQERLAVAPPLQTPSRNPFRFVEREAAVAPPPKPVTTIPPFVEKLIAEPDLVLLGVAEEGSVRTAMIGSGDDLVMAGEGQTVVGRYRVSKVAPDAVELIDLGTGATRRLFLKSPASLP